MEITIEQVKEMYAKIAEINTKVKHVPSWQNAVELVKLVQRQHELETLQEIDRHLKSLLDIQSKIFQKMPGIMGMLGGLR